MKTMKDFAARQLTKKQMNDVRGGAVEMSRCPAGQKEFHCVLTLGYLGVGETGIVCATDQLSAEKAANAILSQVMEVTAEDRYVC